MIRRHRRAFPDRRRHSRLRNLGLFLGPDFGHIRGLEEYIRVHSPLEGQEFTYRLLKAYGDAK